MKNLTTIRLPADLSTLDDAALDLANAQLRAGDAVLYWMDVIVAPAAVLDRLLAGLEADRDADALGADSIPDDSLATLVVEALDRGRVTAARPRRRRGVPIGVAAVFTETDGGDDDSGAAAENAEAVGLDTDGLEPVGPVLAAITSAALRDEFEQMILGDLLGPAGGPEEEVDIAVTERYVLGKLAPQGTVVAPQRGPVPAKSETEDVEEAARVAVEDAAPTVLVESEETREDPEATGPRIAYPSAFGLSFTVDGQSDSVEVAATWGRYERMVSETLVDKDGAPKRVWKRSPRGGAVTLALHEGEIDPPLIPDPEEPEVVVRGRVRRRDGDWAVTLFLDNQQQALKTNKATAWLFQAELSAQARDGGPVFVRRPLPRRRDHDAEARALEMLYRDDLEFAVGHGIGVDWKVAPGDLIKAVAIRTATVPNYELPRTDPPEPGRYAGLEQAVLGMAELGAMDGPRAAAALAPLADAYESWIDGLETRRRADPGLQAYQEAAIESIARCRSALARIREGIETIRTDRRAADAFAFMNRAMAQQRVRSLYSLARRDDPETKLDEFDIPRNRTWRPFQIAFILIGLPALARLDHPDRSAEPTDPLARADLLWFPTGGGKTEAYLGLAAFAMAVRRLQGEVGGRSGDGGICVLMRYTLRLLTLQQFQRATALICAMELLRKEARAAGDFRWGFEPFRIGLWVGYRMTPNSNSGSAEAVKKLKAGESLASGSPAQLTHCPWCGSPIDPRRDIEVETYGNGRCLTIIYCGDKLGACRFSRKQAPGNGLPVLVVDEEIYRRLPALLIATVDKFAQMPWKGATAALFGRVNGWCDRHGYRSPDPALEEAGYHPKKGGLDTVRLREEGPLRPPDLVIQDELHLISGPVGSMVGLYETAIDELSTFDVDGRRIRPKVIASTATIRQAPEQIHALFARQSEVFPPQGLDAGDSFFAEEVSLDTSPGRRYLGVLARGERLKAVLIRVYVAALAAAQTLYKRHGGAADPYMTLVGYFGSMRELGGTRRLVDDDVQARLKAVDVRGFEQRSNLKTKELTSRVGSTEIPRVLGDLGIPFNPAMEQEWRKKGGATKPIDVLLATNMVSVGVDVPRLGLMVVDGQPKTTAEYIQATSRVGRERDKPGVVIAVYNWARPRDLSHYERFRHYHATFYQQVEALSVTPFSPGAIDRGLSGLLAGMVRLGDDQFTPNTGADAIRRNHPEVQAAVGAIVARAELVDEPRTGNHLEQQLDARIDHWVSRIENATGSRVGYSAEAEAIPLLSQPDGGPWGMFTCLNSLRDVEAKVDLVLIDGLLDDGTGDAG